MNSNSKSFQTMSPNICSCLPRPKEGAKGSCGKHNWLGQSPFSTFGYCGGTCQASHTTTHFRCPGPDVIVSFSPRVSKKPFCCAESIREKYQGTGTDTGTDTGTGQVIRNSPSRKHILPVHYLSWVLGDGILEVWIKFPPAFSVSPVCTPYRCVSK